LDPLNVLQKIENINEKESEKLKPNNYYEDSALKNASHAKGRIHTGVTGKGRKPKT
jgi:hypothetical protein